MSRKKENEEVNVEKNNVVKIVLKGDPNLPLYEVETTKEDILVKILGNNYKLEKGKKYLFTQSALRPLSKFTSAGVIIKRI